MPIYGEKRNPNRIGCKTDQSAILPLCNVWTLCVKVENAAAVPAICDFDG